MNRLDDGVRRCRQKSIDLMGTLQPERGERESHDQYDDARRHDGKQKSWQFCQSSN
jgi:hypothetical protein